MPVSPRALSGLDRARSERFSRYRVGGSFEAWLEVARLAESNTRLVLLIATAFSGPVAALLGLEQIGIMLVGPSQAGKTSMLFAAGSVWGCHADPTKAHRLGFAVPLNATDNDLEDELLAANHTLLAVDETRSAGLDDADLGKLLVKMIMRWEIGFEKGRKNAGKARQAASVPFILTSNLSLAELAAKAGITVDDAYHSRLICVPIPNHPVLHPLPAHVHGAFEGLHGEASVVALSRRLRVLATANFGYPSRRFLRFLTAEYHKDSEGLRAWFAARRSAYLKVARKITSPGRTLDRLHEKMATVYAAACFAIKHEILPWTRAAVRDSLLTCTRAHVELAAHETHHVVVPARPSRPMGSSLDPQSLIQRLRQRFEQSKASVVDSRDPGATDRILEGAAECPIIKYQHKKHGQEYLFTEGRLSSIFPGKAELDAVKAALHARGHIATETGADGIPRYSVKRSLPGRRRIQVIAIRAAAFQDGV